jgi:capping protein alpha
LKIANYFILSSPTGEVDEVVADVRKLVGEDVLTDAKLTKSLEDYNKEQMVSGVDPDGVPILVSSFGAVASDLFLDPSSGRIMKFDHRRRKFLEVTDKKQVLEDSVAKVRAAVEKELASYLESSYKSGKYVSAVYGSDSGNLIVCISAANIHLGNFWTGGWRSVYHIPIGKEGTVEIKGDIKVNVHYFEDGNVQLHGKYPVKGSVSIDGKAAASIVKAIKTIETDFQSNLELLYIEMHRETFKQMRRFWPISKQPMNWNLSAHKMAGELSGSTS